MLVDKKQLILRKKTLMHEELRWLSFRGESCLLSRFLCLNLSLGWGGFLSFLAITAEGRVETWKLFLTSNNGGNWNEL
jgi:hypothetical protein